MLLVRGKHFVWVCRIGGLKVNADKIKVIVLHEKEEFDCEVIVDGMWLEHVSKFKYLWYRCC